MNLSVRNMCGASPCRLQDGTQAKPDFRACLANRPGWATHQIESSLHPQLSVKGSNWGCKRSAALLFYLPQRKREMLLRSLLGLACGLVLLVSSVQAQHAGDLEFKYDGGQIVIVNGEEGFADGKKIFEAEMGYGGLFDGYTEEPGFISEVDVGLGIGANDIISYSILQSRFGYFLNYWNPTTGLVENTSSSLEIDGLASMTISSLLGGGGVLGQADNAGDFHSHFDFQLSPGSNVGAYAILVNMQTNASGIGNSDPFYIVFGYGIDEAQHGAAVEHFAGVPEPGSIGLLACAAVAGLARFRRKTV
ncbi:MAG: PEP-CTERM sorting domain-containing protein [Planctomycetota bacterium]